MRVVNFLTLCHHSLGHEKKALLNVLENSDTVASVMGAMYWTTKQEE